MSRMIDKLGPDSKLLRKDEEIKGPDSESAEITYKTKPGVRSNSGVPRGLKSIPLPNK